MTFNKWFKAQHGERLRGDRRDDAELARIAADGTRAVNELRRRTNWDDRYQSALYGWQARTAVGGPCPKKPAKKKAKR